MPPMGKKCQKSVMVASALSVFANRTVKQGGKDVTWKVAVAAETGTGCGAFRL